jgi:hypothetical protein
MFQKRLRARRGISGFLAEGNWPLCTADARDPRRPRQLRHDWRLRCPRAWRAAERRLGSIQAVSPMVSSPRRQAPGCPAVDSLLQDATSWHQRATIPKAFVPTPKPMRPWLSVEGCWQKSAEDTGARTAWSESTWGHSAPMGPPEHATNPRHCHSVVTRWASRRRQKKYDSPQSTLVIAEGPTASGPSPIERWAMSAETRLMAKPA